MQHYLVTLRDDRGATRQVKAVIESDESISRLSSHSHIVEVHGLVNYKGKVPTGEGKAGFVEVTEDEAAELLGHEAPAEETEPEEVEPEVKKKK